MAKPKWIPIFKVGEKVIAVIGQSSRSGYRLTSILIVKIIGHYSCGYKVKYVCNLFCDGIVLPTTQLFYGWIEQTPLTRYDEAMNIFRQLDYPTYVKYEKFFLSQIERIRFDKTPERVVFT